MPWKKDDSGVLAVDGSGNPVWVSDSGEESGADYGLTLKRLGEVNAESKKRKEELRALLWWRRYSRASGSTLA